jgi:hypothetical protein
MTMRTCPCGFHASEPQMFSREWHELHQVHHLNVFPDCDQVTRANLADFIRWAGNSNDADGSYLHSSPSASLGRPVRRLQLGQSPEAAHSGTGPGVELTIQAGFPS